MERLCALIAPHYPTREGGRPPIPLERMLRIYFLQQWFNLSDPGVEEALYDMVSMRTFAGIDLGDAPVPDETTVCKFRHLLEQNHLGPAILREVNQFLASRKVKISAGTIVNATIIEAPSSAKNSSGERDPEMHQTKKGNEWHFGVKAHIGVDSKSRLVHSFVATPANVHDSRVLPDLLHGKETRVWGDSAYRGQTAAIRGKAPSAADFTQPHSRVLRIFRFNSANRIVRNRVCVLASSMSSTFSSASSVLQTFAIVDLRKMRIGWP